jgi:integrase
VRRLRPSQLQNVVAALLAKPIAPGTVHTVVQHLQQVLNGAVHDQLLVRSPGKGLVLPRVVPKVVIPSPEEVAAIGDHVAPSSRVLVVVGAGLGLRQGEACGLSVDRIDFLRRRVIIERQLKKTSDQGLHLSPILKTEGSNRTIPLPEAVANALARHIAEHPNDDPDGLVFTTRLGCRWRASTWNSIVLKPAVSAAGRPELRFHALRHCYASALIRHGLHAPVIAKRMGNSAAEVLKTYSHLWRDDDERTRDAIDDALAI